jgi:hypothetical protein
VRPELLVPEELTPELAMHLLGFIGEDLMSLTVVRAWAPLELAIVADWAIREHLAGSDVLIRRRPRPSLLGPE